MTHFFCLARYFVSCFSLLCWSGVFSSYRPTYKSGFREIYIRPWWNTGLVWTKGKISWYLLTDHNWRTTQFCHLKVDSRILQPEGWLEKVLFLCHCPYVTEPSDSAWIRFQPWPYCVFPRVLKLWGHFLSSSCKEPTQTTNRRTRLSVDMDPWDVWSRLVQSSPFVRGTRGPLWWQSTLGMLVSKAKRLACWHSRDSWQLGRVRKRPLDWTAKIIVPWTNTISEEQCKLSSIFLSQSTYLQIFKPILWCTLQCF